MHDNDEPSAFAWAMQAALHGFETGDIPLLHKALHAAMGEPDARFVPEVDDARMLFYFLLAHQWKACALFYKARLIEAEQPVPDAEEDWPL